MPRPSHPPRAWQRMVSGRRLDLLDPSPLDIEIEDIARGLARVARWNGQTTGPHAFSVAQHSVIVEDLLVRLYPRSTTAERLTALLHDAPEYVVGDMISPFKAALGLDYKAFEARLQRAIHIRFGLPPETDPRLYRRIKRCDTVCAWFEAVRIAGFTEEEGDAFFTAPPDGVDVSVSPMSVVDAETAFLERFRALAA